VTSILHVISGLGTGGAENMLVRLACGLRHRGFQQHVVSVSSKGAHAEDLEASGIGVTALGVRSVVGAPAGVFRLAGVIRTFAPQVVQGWMYYGDLFAALAHKISSRQQSRRLFWNLRASNTDEGGYGAIVRGSAWISGWPDLVVANSKAGLDFHRANGYRPRRAEVIPNGIDVDRFRPDPRARVAVRTELSIPDNDIVAIHVARVDPMKDHGMFLEAMAGLPGIRGILVGAGTEQLKRPPNVLAVGLRRDIERLYAAADLVVSTSAYAEGFSNVIAEGMSTGLVPIATDVGDARLVVGDSDHVVPIREPKALAALIAAVADAPRAERTARGLQSRTRIVEQFSLARAVDRYAGLYAER
jgi:glycosyltransferase involved in cell wall biosynthesis